MNPIKTARQLRGLSQIELAQRLGITPQALSAYERGERQPGPKLLPILSEALCVSPAYLRGDAQHLSVWDWVSEEPVLCAIISETPIEDYGILYIVEADVLSGPTSVILADGVQFTLSDWQGEQVMTADDIADPPNGYWVDPRGNRAVMMDGLPRILWG